MIFAAGLGTRLGEITKNTPKALVPVGGVPMLQRVMLKLRDAGLREVVVNIFHHADKIEEFLSANADFGMSVQLSREPGPVPLETGGGIRHAAPLLRGSEPFLVHNVDILSDVDLADFAGRSHPGALANLLVTQPRPEDNRFFLFDSDMRLVGWTNTTTGEVKGAVRDVSALVRMSFTGIHLISQDIFPLLESWPERFSIVDFYLRQAERHPIYGVPAREGVRIIDIGNPATLAEADALFGA